MEFVARINYEWDARTLGYNAEFVNGPNGMTEAQAKDWIKSELDKTYGSEWRLEDGQYVHVKSHAGLAVLATCDRTLTPDEIRQQKIIELKATILMAQAELATLQAAEPPVTDERATFDPQANYVKVKGGWDQRKDKAVVDYDPSEGEGNKEDGWGKCVVCQAFTIDPETERCIHWDKDVEHHEMWYAASDGAE